APVRSPDDEAHGGDEHHPPEQAHRDHVRGRLAGFAVLGRAGIVGHHRVGLVSRGVHTGVGVLSRIHQITPRRWNSETIATARIANTTAMKPVYIQRLAWSDAQNRRTLTTPFTTATTH